MVKRQRIAKWFLCLACLVVLTCMTQRMAGLHALQQTLGSRRPPPFSPVIPPPKRSRRPVN